MVEQDRRVRRTRTTLHEAFISLVLVKGYERLTVQDVLDRADVGRSTFYAHYRDKEALLTATFDDIREQLTRDFAGIGSADAPVGVDRPAALIFDHAFRNQRVYRALCGKQGGTIVVRYLRDMIADLLLQHLRGRSPVDSRESAVPDEVIAEFFASATVGVLTWWIDHDFERDPQRLAEDIRLLSTAGSGPASTT